MKNDLVQKYGGPFQFRTVDLPSYPTINYGDSVRVMQEPNLTSLPNVDFLTLMLSRPCDHFLRHLIRCNTRETQHEKGFHLVFVIALSPNATCNKMIEEENGKYGDILQFNHSDGYHFITLSVFHAFHYVEKLHLPVKYVVKTDSDCVINYDLLYQRIAIYDEARQNKLYMGMCHVRNTYNYKQKHKKNYVPKALLRRDTFIRYFTDGGGYVISYHLLPQLLLTLRHLPFIAHNEDMNVGKGMIMLGVPCTHDPFWLARKGCTNKRDCLRYVVMHPKEDIEETMQFYSYLHWCVCFHPCDSSFQ